MGRFSCRVDLKSSANVAGCASPWPTACEKGEGEAERARGRGGGGDGRRARRRDRRRRAHP
jgi:hypothetical protein